MKSISVKNYRSIEDSGKIDICPLTVCVGKNSAGKSSFVRLFPLLKQTVERKISDTLLWYGDYVDFGDYKHTVSKQNPEEPIEIAFSLMTSKRIYRYLRKKATDEFIISVELSIREKYIENVKINFFDQTINLLIDSDGKTKVLINEDERPFENKSLIAIRETRDIIPSLHEEETTEEYMRFHLDVGKLVSYCKNYIYTEKEKKENIIMPFRDELEIQIGAQKDILTKLKKINPNKFEKMEIHHKRFKKINNYIIATKIVEIIDRINAAFYADMEQTNYLKPIRAMVNRYYRVQGISIDELDADGSNLPMILKNMSATELENFEKWSKEKFGVVFSVTSAEGHISLIIKNDISGNEITNVADTGYGYSQMLPIVMLLWMIHRKKSWGFISEKTIVIEQPELHLHPAYQAKMIDVFVNIIREARNEDIDLKIILETHSETMINRIGTLISEKRISSENVNILIFDKKEEKTKIVSKKFNDNGLLQGWPIGFFAIEED